MNIFRYVILGFIVISTVQAQERVQFIRHDAEKRVDVMIGGKLFTSYLYTDNIDKPVLYPINTSSGNAVTRGFPLDPRPGERTDHPHHVGLWFNYGNVNGLDFWNNSYAIKESDKPKYGSIRHQKIVKVEQGTDKGILMVTANWVDVKGTILLTEETTFIFSGTKGKRVIERATKLTAVKEKVSFKDNKEGMLGLRVTRELEIPSDKPDIFTDDKGNPTTVPVLNNEGVTGTYLTSEGKKGDDAWGTRGRWCLMYGKKNGTSISIAILDHPENPGYPTYWHARGYGLFAANNLGQEALSGGKEKLNFELEAGKSVTFRYKIVIADGFVPSVNELNALSDAFGKEK